MFLLEYDEEEILGRARRVARKEGLAEGREEGLEQGLEQGREQGLAEGREQGLAEGREEERFLAIRSVMANLSLTVEQALDALGIPAEDRPYYETILAEEV